MPEIESACQCVRDYVKAGVYVRYGIEDALKAKPFQISAQAIASTSLVARARDCKVATGPCVVVSTGATEFLANLTAEKPLGADGPRLGVALIQAAAIAKESDVREFGDLLTELIDFGRSAERWDDRKMSEGHVVHRFDAKAGMLLQGIESLNRPGRFDSLRTWAAENCGPKQQKYLEILIDGNGRQNLNDLATEMGWYEEQRDSQQNSYQTAINKKLRPKVDARKQPYRIERQKGVVYLREK